MVAVDLQPGLPELLDLVAAQGRRGGLRLLGHVVADWYDVDAGRLQEGDRADVPVIDPARLDATLDEHHEAPVPQCGGLSRMVNRNDVTVRAVFVRGPAVVLGGEPTELVGDERTGAFLRAGLASAPVPAAERSAAPEADRAVAAAGRTS